MEKRYSYLGALIMVSSVPPICLYNLGTYTSVQIGVYRRWKGGKVFLVTIRHSRIAEKRRQRKNEAREVDDLIQIPFYLPTCVLVFPPGYGYLTFHFL